MIPVVVVSLVRSVERRAAMTARLDAIDVPFTFFDAVDGSLMTAAQAAAACLRSNPRRYGEYLRPAEIGCIESFRLVCDRIARGDDAHVCVMEDDVTLDQSACELLDEGALRNLPPFDILRLQHHSERWLPVAARGSFRVGAPLRPTYGTRAHVFSRAGAAKVAAGLANPWMPIDMAVFSDGIVHDLRILEVAPPVAFHPDAQDDISTIDPTETRPRARHESRARATLVRRARRSVYESASRLRVLRNFVRQWGWSALLRVRRA